MCVHEEPAAATALRIYFCDPHLPWQRGTNVNANGLLRQYLAKDTDLTVHSEHNLRQVADRVNHRPGLCLGDQHPPKLWKMDHRTDYSLVRNDR